MTDQWDRFAAAALPAVLASGTPFDDIKLMAEIVGRIADAMVAEAEKRRAVASSERAPVPRGHCGRCDRCGWEYEASIDFGCTPGNCSMRPLPSLRSNCAGCGASFEEG